MKSIPERLTIITDYNGDLVYAEPEIRSIATHMADPPGGLLVVCEDDILTEVALFRFSSGPATKDGIEVSPACFECIFHGGGPSGVLTEAFKALQWWFDV